MVNASVCLERSNGVSFQYISMSTTMHKYVFVYKVIKDRQKECGQPCYHFQKSPFWSIYTEKQPQSFQTKMGSAAFSNVCRPTLLSLIVALIWSCHGFSCTVS